MRSRTSRGVPEWSGGKDLYMGSPVLVAGKFSGFIGNVPGDPETFPMAEIPLPIYNSSPPDHSGTSRDVRDLIRDSEQLLGFRIHISLQP